MLGANNAHIWKYEYGARKTIWYATCRWFFTSSGISNENHRQATVGTFSHLQATTTKSGMIFIMMISYERSVAGPAHTKQRPSERRRYGIDPMRYSEEESEDITQRKLWTCWTIFKINNTPTEQLSIQAWWRHKLETFSALLALCAGNSPMTGEFPAQRPVTRTVDAFSLICAWTKCCANNQDAGDLSRHRAHYDVTVIRKWSPKFPSPTHTCPGYCDLDS